MYVIIEESKCTACGTCVDVCPVEAITVDQVVHIDPENCIDCGSCIYECSEGALSMADRSVTDSSSSTSVSASAQMDPPGSEEYAEPLHQAPGVSGDPVSGRSVGFFGRLFGLGTGGGQGRGHGKGKKKGGGKGGGRGSGGGRRG